jgi:hypothetical protein
MGAQRAPEVAFGEVHATAWSRAAHLCERIIDAGARARRVKVNRANQLRRESCTGELTKESVLVISGVAGH